MGGTFCPTHVAVCWRWSRAPCPPPACGRTGGATRRAAGSMTACGPLRGSARRHRCQAHPGRLHRSAWMESEGPCRFCSGSKTRGQSGEKHALRYPSHRVGALQKFRRRLKTFGSSAAVSRLSNVLANSNILGGLETRVVTLQRPSYMQTVQRI